MKRGRSALPLSTSASDLLLIAQADRSYPGCHVEAGVAFDADWLQRDRPVGAADQHIGAGSDPDRGAPGRADVIARQGSRRETAARREHSPYQHAALRIADVDAEFVDRAGIVF